MRSFATLRMTGAGSGQPTLLRQRVQRLLGVGVVLRRRLLEPGLGLGRIGRQSCTALGQQQSELALRLAVARQRCAFVPVGAARAVWREAAARWLGQRVEEGGEFELGRWVAR